MKRNQPQDTRDHEDSQEKEPKFTWAKKQQQDKKAGVSEAQRSRIDDEKKADVQRELEKLKQRREERDSQRQQDNSFVVHRSAQQDHENRVQDQAFSLQQQKHRTPIRIKQARALPVDLLAINLFLAADQQLSHEFAALGIDCSLDDPYTLVKAMSLDQLTSTLDDVTFFVTNEPTSDKLYWQALAVVITHRTQTLTTPLPLNPQVLSRIHEIVDAKSASELQVLETGVATKLEGGGVIDVGYWDGLLGCIKARRANLTLLGIHRGVLERRLLQLKSERETEMTEQVYKAEENVKSQAVLYHPTAEDIVQTEGIREQMFMREASQLMEIDEEEFNTNEINLSTTNYQWQDKYRPRKPKYFNRVQTGYEWNSYNRVHYDDANLPPKIVQGYKFNIFYPDLLNATSSPSFTLTPDPEQPLTTIITFTAGPPYEQVAFRIVGKEWEYGHKRGFKSCFDKGVLQLYFQFRRHVYKR